MFGAGSFGLFAEMLLVGLGVSVLSLLAVTALPAFAAGIAHVRRHLQGRPDGVADLGRDFLAALRGGWVWGVVVAVVLAVLGFNLAAAASGTVPGGAGVLVVTALVAGVVVVALLRSAVRWERGARWRALLAAGARETYDDVVGTGLLLLAVGLSGVIVWMFAPLVVIVPGLLSFAVAAVEARTR
ncbi:hypothetical protein ET471_09555 [Xylanimonas protaetiae]|uniref:Poxvirus protein I5 n=1 Tax=Xylanimonas protaetiae TaxID=2509457 RepID=A0A4P6F8H6_9MICO|nr:hypothetical protein ET471_09555 [Xylanimonas protaetiae]